MELLTELSIAEICALHNRAIEMHSLPVRTAKKFTDRKSAYARIEHLMSEYALQLWGDGDTVNLIAMHPEKDATEDTEYTAVEAEADAKLDKSTQEFQAFWSANKDKYDSFGAAQAAWLAGPQPSLTPLQFALMDLIAHHEMNTTNGATPTVHSDVNTWLWADEFAKDLGISGKACGGLLAGLEVAGYIGMNKVKKPKTKFGGAADDSTVWFTPEGFNAWQAVKATQPFEAPTKVEKAPTKVKKTPTKVVGPKAKFADHQVITVLVDNPKKPGSLAFIRYAKYVNGMTIRAALEAGLHRTDFKWDVAHGHIKIV